MRTVAGAAAKLAAQSFAIDGEAVVCGPDANCGTRGTRRRGLVKSAGPDHRSPAII